MSKINNVYEFLNYLQKNLNAPKKQFNNFGKYAYRNVEDIMEGIKPLLLDQTYVTCSDEIVEVGGRVYVKATATVGFNEQTIVNTAYAREAESKKGMDDSQLTGATSSYARKYALGGLLLVDDNKDADSVEAKKEGIEVIGGSMKDSMKDVDNQRFIDSAKQLLDGCTKKKALDDLLKNHLKKWETLDGFNEIKKSIIKNKLRLSESIEDMNKYFNDGQAAWRENFGVDFVKELSIIMEQKRNV